MLIIYSTEVLTGSEGEKSNDNRIVVKVRCLLNYKPFTKSQSVQISVGWNIIDYALAQDRWKQELTECMYLLAK